MFFSCTRKQFWHTARTMTERATLSELKKLDPEALVALIVAQQEQITAQQEQLLSRT
jgi:hypothetical protein